MAATHHAPEPPVPLPPGRIVHVPGRGEFFVRDSGGDGPAVLLLHGWMFPSDLNWFTVYDALAAEGLRVLAMDHRGHGRGLRTSEKFTLRDCAGDAAALVEHLGCGPVTAVGYSMGGPVACLMAREHRDAVRGIVLCATAQDWQGKRMSVFWKGMASIRFWMGLAPTQFWKLIVKGSRVRAGSEREWVAAELSRGSSVDIAEAGRELSRYDAKPWIGELRGLPAAVVVTARDRSVPPGKQRALAEALGARKFEVQADHMAVTTDRREFWRMLLGALDHVGATGKKLVRAA